MVRQKEGKFRQSLKRKFCETAHTYEQKKRSCIIEHAWPWQNVVFGKLENWKRQRKQKNELKCRCCLEKFSKLVYSHKLQY